MRIYTVRITTVKHNKFITFNKVLINVRSYTFVVFDGLNPNCIYSRTHAHNVDTHENAHTL
jgi:hypothetical protein